MNKILQPEDILIEKTALAFAAEFYEIGRGQGLKSKWKTPKSFAKNNFEKFIPRVVDDFLTILNNPNFDASAKDMIWKAIQKRHNDPNLQTGNELPNIDVKKLISLVDTGKVDHSPENLKVIELMNKAKETKKPFIMGQDNG